MRRKVTMLVAAVVVVGFLLPAVFAGGPGDKAGTQGGTCELGKGVCKPGAPFSTMTFKVGDKTYERLTDAEKAAKTNKTKVDYIVGDKIYNNHDEAMAALAKYSECFVGHFLKIGYVQDDGKVVYRPDDPKEPSPTQMAWGDALKHGNMTTPSGGTEGQAASPGEHNPGMTNPTEMGTPTTFDPSKYKKWIVAGHEYTNWNDAVKARDNAFAAIEKVKVTYLANGKAADKWNEDCEKAWKAGKLTYRIDGDRTNSEDTARAWLAKAQWEAANNALQGMGMTKHRMW